MGKGWLPVLEVGSLEDAGGVEPRGLNHLRGLFGNSVLEKGKGPSLEGGAGEGPQERESGQCN